MTQTTYFLAALFLVGLFVVMVSSYPTDRASAEVVASESGEEAVPPPSAENTLAETEIQEPAPAATMQGESEHCDYITAASLQDYEWGLEFCRTPLAELGDVLSLHVTGSGSMRPTFEIEIGEDLANGMVRNAFYSDRRRGEAHSEQLVGSWWERATHLFLAHQVSQLHTPENRSKVGLGYWGREVCCGRQFARQASCLLRAGGQYVGRSEKSGAS